MALRYPTMRPAVSCAIGLWLLPVLAAGVHAFGPPAWLSIAAGAGVALPLAWWAGRALAPTLRPLQETPVVLGVVALLAGVSIVEIGRISVFMADVNRVEYSYSAGDPWRVKHSCFTAYGEALRLAHEGGRIYDVAAYEPRNIGPLRVDSFHYPPVFLLLPQAIHAVRGDFFAMRALWFVMQALVLAGVIFTAAQWVGGRSGAWLAAGGTLALATPQLLFAVQQGNVQATAMPLGVAAMMLIAGRRVASGAVTLAYITAAKIFPGILVVYLLAARRGRAVAITVACGITLAVLTLLLFGAGPFREFITDEVPRISNGSAFPQSEFPASRHVNLSLYGLTVRARALGAAWLDQPTGLRVASVYGIALLAFAAFAGWRSRWEMASEDARLRLVQLSLGLLSLASFRSPFVGVYGYVATVWLMTALAAGARGAPGRAMGLVLTAAFCWAHWHLPSAARTATSIEVLTSALLFLAAVAAGVLSVTRSIRPVRAAVPVQVGGSAAPA